MPHFKLAARTSYDFEFAPNRDLGYSMQTEALPGLNSVDRSRFSIGIRWDSHEVTYRPQTGTPSTSLAAPRRITVSTLGYFIFLDMKHDIVFDILEYTLRN